MMLQGTNILTLPLLAIIILSFIIYSKNSGRIRNQLILSFIILRQKFKRFRVQWMLWKRAKPGGNALDFVSKDVWCPLSKCVRGDGRNWEQNWESGEWEEREISIISLSPPTETCQRSSEPLVQNSAAPSLTRTWKPCSEYNLLTHQLHHWQCPIFIVYACGTNYTTLGGWSDKILLILSH